MLGAALLAYAVDDYRKAVDSLSWAPVEGTLMSDAIEGGVFLQGATYVYVVDGMIFESRRTRFYNNNRWWAQVEGQLKMTQTPNRSALILRQGQRVSVYSNPQRPAFSVLVQGVSVRGFLVLLIPCITLLFIGSGGLWFLLSRRSF